MSILQGRLFRLLMGWELCRYIELVSPCLPQADVQIASFPLSAYFLFSPSFFNAVRSSDFVPFFPLFRSPSSILVFASYRRAVSNHSIDVVSVSDNRTLLINSKV